VIIFKILLIENLQRILSKINIDLYSFFLLDFSTDKDADSEIQN
jgi:hypothetical protein